jgi:Putative amidase domain
LASVSVFLDINCTQKFDKSLHNKFVYMSKLKLKKLFKYSQIVSSLIIFSLVIPLFVQEIQANAICINKLQNDLQKQIDILSDLENSQTLEDRGNQTKKNFNEEKNKITDKKLDKFKNEVLEKVKNKYSSVGSVDVIEEYYVTFDKEDNNNILSKVHRLTDFKDGLVLNNTFEFRVDTKSGEINELSQLKSNNSLEDKDFAKKLSLQNDSNGFTKVNALGQSDEEVAKLIKAKENNTKNSPKITPQESKKKLNEDRRTKYKSQKQQLLQEKQNPLCNSVKVNAERNQWYDRYAAIDYANARVYSRNPWYADFRDLGGNCTNFVSQAMQVGRYNNDYTFYSEPSQYSYYNIGKTNDGPFTNFNVPSRQFYVSPAFRAVMQHKSYVWTRDYTSNYYFWKNWKSNGSIYQSNGVTYPTLWEGMFQNGNVTDGDVVWADWENDGLWDHTMIITNWYFDYGKWMWLPILTYNDRNNPGIKFTDLKNMVDSGANFVTIKL